MVTLKRYDIVQRMVLRLHTPDTAVHPAVGAQI